MGIEAPDKPEHLFIRVSTWGSSASDVVRNPAHALTTSAEEAGALDHGKDMLGLWVGLKPVQAEAMRAISPKDTGLTRDDKQALEELRRIKVPKSSSVDTVARFKKLPVWTRVDGMRRAVVRFNSLHSSKLLFYELVNRDANTMLCEAYPIEGQDVFYFHEYRTDSMTSSHLRDKEWRKNIKAYLAQILNDSLDNGGFRPARSTERAQLPRRAAQLVDVHSMVNQLASTGSEWLLDNIERASRDVCKDFKDADIEQRRAMRTLIDLDVDFNKEAAANTYNWLAETFHDLCQSGYLTVDMVLGYGKHLRTHRTPMTLNKVKASISLYIDYQLDHPNDGTTEECESFMARKMQLYHVDTNGQPPKFKEVSSDLEIWLKDHIGIMQHLVDSQQAGVNALIDYHSGTASGPDNLDQLWENYGHSADTDSTKHFALQAMRFYAKEIAAQCSKSTSDMQEYINMLKQQHKEISDTRTDAHNDVMEE
ncbi:unnamed protein product [Alternaria alternata]